MPLEKAARSPNFPVPKANREIACVLPGKQIGDGSDPKRRGMGRHMPAIRKQRHRAKKRSRRNFADHHDGGDRDNEPGPAFVAGMLLAKEHVIVDPLVDRVRVHGYSSLGSGPRI